MHFTTGVADPIAVGGFTDPDRHSADEYYKVEVQDVLVSSYQSGGHASGIGATAVDDLATSGGANGTIAVGGYIRIKKLNSGG